MHPSPNALVAMTSDDLAAYRAEVHELAIDSPDPTRAYQERKNLIDAILADRKTNDVLPVAAQEDTTPAFGSSLVAFFGSALGDPPPRLIAKDTYDRFKDIEVSKIVNVRDPEGRRIQVEAYGTALDGRKVWILLHVGDAQVVDAIAEAD